MKINAIPGVFPYVLFCFVLLLTDVYPLKAQCPAATPLVINSVTTTESRCQASGTATVSASGGSTPYSYSIISGPTLAAPQSSGILQSLPAGIYKVEVTDNCNTSVTGTFIVAGTYAVPSLSIGSQSPSCPSSTDGSITITVANGRAPLAYSLVSPSPVTTGPQASNVFAGLPVGTYTCQVTDSCGNFETSTVTLTTSSTVTFSQSNFRYVACDSFAYSVQLNVSSSYKPPYTLTLPLPDGQVLTHVLTGPPVGGLLSDTFYFHYHHVTGSNDVLTLTAANSCGVSQSTAMQTNGFDMVPKATLPTTCGGQYTYTLDYLNDNAASPSPWHCNTITYTLISPSGTVLATQTNNSSFTGYPPGTGYQVIRQDCCRKDTLQFDWGTPPAFSITGISVSTAGTCKEGTAGVTFVFNPGNKSGNVVLASGPPSLTTADGIVHALTYPDTVQDTYLGTLFYVDNLAAGTYKAYATTTCGETDTVTFTIDSAQLRHSTFAETLVKGCSGANKILLNATTNSVIGPAYDYGHVTVNASYSNYFWNSPFEDSILNVSPGTTWYATFQYLNPLPANSPAGMNWGCDVISDTIVVTPYTQPVFSSSAAVAICGSTRQVALVPDSNSGVTPYAFQIVAGPTTTPLQSSPVFSGLSSGTYTFQMVDACANSYSLGISIDTLSAPVVAITGNTCAGGAATFTLPSSPFYSYSWQLPGGGTSTGNSLTVNPIANPDTGTYTISVTSTIGGCTNTTSTRYVLNYCTVLPTTLLSFTGQWNAGGGIAINWQTTGEVNLSHYTVQRSTDGYSFTPLQTVAAAGGPLNNYMVIDRQVPYGTVYYRLQIASNSGEESYSEDISFNNAKTASFAVYPTLISENMPVTISCPPTSSSTYVQVIGTDGRVYQTSSIPAGATTGRINLVNVASGCYFIVLRNNGNMEVTKVWRR